jgi:S-adenosylmethionine-dependent methyltransferase
VTADDVCVDCGAERYAEYLETPAGRLRCDLAFANLEDFLPAPAARSGRALDLGGGTGEIAIRLARRGFDVTLLDQSPAMLETSDHAIRRAGMSHRVALIQGDVAAVPSLFSGDSFDVVVLHHVLEYAGDPGLVLRGAAHVLRRERTAVLSVVARNRMGAVFAAAIQSGDPAAVRRALTAATTEEPLCGGRARLFTMPELRTLLAQASLEPVAERGVRIVFDYLPPSAARDAGASRGLVPEGGDAGAGLRREPERPAGLVPEGGDAGDRVATLERILGAIPDFSAVARYAQMLARRR